MVDERSRSVGERDVAIRLAYRKIHTGKYWEVHPALAAVYADGHRGV